MQTSETIHPEKTAKKTKQNIQNIGDFVSGRLQSNAYIANGKNGYLTIVWTQPSIVRIKFHLKKTADLSTTIAVQPTSSIPVEPIQISELSDEIILQSEQVKIVLNKKPLNVSVYHVNGNLAWKTDEWTYDIKGVSTVTGPFTNTTNVYGMGETTSFLNKRGERYTMWNSDVYSPHVPQMESLYLSVPFKLLFNQGEALGVYLDNAGKCVFDYRARQDGYIIQCPTGELDFYVIVGPTLNDVLNGYTSLTGRMSMPPKWSLGYHQSRYSYMSQDEVYQIALKFREKQIPCDVIYLDIHYMDEYRVFTFDRFRFPEPEKLIRGLKELGIRVIPIVDPGVKKDPRYKVYQEGIQKDYFCQTLEGKLFYGNVWPGECAFPDFSNPEVAEWWSDMHQYYLDMGVEGIWNDMNEPAVFNESKTMDLDVVHHNEGNPKTHEEIHNLYGIYMTRATYDGIKKKLNGKRPFLLTRAGFSGIQRYGAVWTGDNRSFWEHLQLASPMLLNLGLSGVAFTGTDIGGFAHHASAELLARWTQIGVLSPFCRNHSAIDTLHQEPWAFGPEIEAICKKYIELRYRWMPMLYTFMEECSRTGAPVLRPLVWEFPEDQTVYPMSDQWMFGSSIMVAPIDRPNTSHRVVYFPQGVWYNYWTNETYLGTDYRMIEAKLDTLPLFVKAGTILFEDPVKPHIEANSMEPLTISIYYDPNSKQASGQLYEDDGNSFNFQQGIYNRIQFDYKQEGANATFTFEYLQRGYVDAAQPWIIKVKHTGLRPTNIAGLEQKPKHSWKSIQPGWYYNEDTNEIVLHLMPSESKASYAIEAQS